jgi:hypothetical protein
MHSSKRQHFDWELSIAAVIDLVISGIPRSSLGRRKAAGGEQQRKRKSPGT